jgi:hypothetical protein
MFTKPRIVCALLVVWAAVAGLAPVLAESVGMTGSIIAWSCAGAVLVIAVSGVLLSAWIAPTLGALAVTTLALVMYGILAGEQLYVGIGVLGVMLVASAALISYRLGELVDGTAGRDTKKSPNTRLEDLLESLHEHSMLSDTAKRVLFREKELDLLRRVIEDDIDRGDYNAALRLCDDMGEVFGYRQEAERFRERAVRTRDADYQNQVHGAFEQLTTFLADRDWARAHEVAARMRRLFPEDHVGEEIDARIHRARAEHKEELERAFLEAAGKEDVELAMDYLRQLDRYLTPEESERLQEAAQDVVHKHRSNLGVQFKLAVNDHRWVDAARIGDSIIDEFPNSKMAEEVGGMIEVLRTRASQKAASHG